MAYESAKYVTKFEDVSPYLAPKRRALPVTEMSSPPMKGFVPEYEGDASDLRAYAHRDDQWPRREGSLGAKPVYQLPFRVESSARPVQELPVGRTDSSSRQVYNIGVDQLRSSSTRQVHNHDIFRSESSTRQVYNPIPGRTDSSTRQVHNANFVQTSSSIRQVHTSGLYRSHSPPYQYDDVSLDWKNLMTAPPSHNNDVYLSQETFCHLFPLDRRLDIMSLNATSFIEQQHSAQFLTDDHFSLCNEPWALSQILIWLKWLLKYETDVLRETLFEYVKALFKYQTPILDLADRERLADYAIRAMLATNALINTGGRLEFGSGRASGVLIQLSGRGCYSPRLHRYQTPGRCYSHHCGRTASLTLKWHRSNSRADAPYQRITVPSSIDEHDPLLQFTASSTGSRHSPEEDVQPFSESFSELSAADNDALSLRDFAIMAVLDEREYVQDPLSRSMSALAKDARRRELSNNLQKGVAEAQVQAPTEESSGEKDTHAVPMGRPNILKRLYSSSTSKQASAEFFGSLDYDVLFIMPLLSLHLSSSIDEYDSNLHETMDFILQKIKDAKRDLTSKRSRLTALSQGKKRGKSYFIEIRQKLSSEMSMVDTCQDRVTSYLDIMLRAALFDEIEELKAKRASTCEALNAIKGALREVESEVKRQLGMESSSPCEAKDETVEAVTPA